MDEVQRPQRPVLQKERIVLLRQTLELFQRLALVTFIHLDVVRLGPLFPGFRSISLAFSPFLPSTPVTKP